MSEQSFHDHLTPQRSSDSLARPKLESLAFAILIAFKRIGGKNYFIIAITFGDQGAGVKLHQVRALLAISETGSIRMAARMLNLTQPALSKSVSELEKELGIPILNRSSSGATITSWGRSILERCRTIDAEIQSISEDAALLRENWSGRLRIGIISVVAGQEIVTALRNLRDRFPGIQISIHELRPQTVTQFVRDGIIDIGITTTIAHNLPSTISSEQICEMDYVILGSKRTIASIGSKNRLDQIAEYPWVNASENERSAAHFFDIFDRTGVKRPSDWINCSSAFVALGLVKKDGFLCIWPKRAFEMMQIRSDFAEVEELKLEHPLPKLVVRFVYRDKDLLTEPARRFLSLIMAAGLDGDVRPL